MSKKKNFTLNGNTYVLSTVPRSQLTEVWGLQKRLLEIATPLDLCIGSVLTNEEAVECIQRLLEILNFSTPKGEAVKLTLDDFEDFTVLGDLFLGEKSGGKDDTNTFTESWLSSVNRFAFLPTVRSLITSLELERMKHLMENPLLAQQMNNLLLQ